MDFTKEQLNSLSIYEIRSIARRVGVHSPTTLKKGNCIQKILQILSGEEQPHCKTHNKGRPVLELTNVNSFSDVFLHLGRQEPNIEQPNVFLEFTKIASGNNIAENGKETTANGFLEILDSGFGFLFENKFDESRIFVNEHLIKKFVLGVGDFLEVKCKGFVGSDKLAVIDVIKINDCLPEAHVKKMSSISNGVIKSDQTILAAVKAKKGDRVAVVDNLVNTRRKVFDLFDKHSGDKMLIATNLVEQDFCQKPNVYNVDALANSVVAERQMRILFTHALSIAKQGKDIVLFVTDMSFLPKALMMDGLIGDKIDGNALRFAKKLFASSASFRTGSLTIVAGLNKDAFNGELINKEFLEIANIVL